MLKSIPTIVLIFSVIYIPYLISNDDLQESIKRGAGVYANHCSSCHMADGEGIKGTFPPLAQSDYLMEDKERSIKIILQGLDESIEVNGVAYSVPMASMDYLEDKQIADVLNYIRNSWGNEGEIVQPDQVSEIRSAIKTN
ncbi:c-type cytochrome [Pararhodonellum marinum]|uniref:c-type cytochrome n=1 Tax=Pararhodonellum marinum TaxID=2755358 RepID=UPI00188FE0DA|nr:cytochrome c [Pararhodonellum marinum]